MQLIKAYLYPIIVEVQIPDPTIFTVRKRTVYTRPIKAYQGVDNPLQIVVINQDNKPVNCTGFSVQLDIQDPMNQRTIKSYAVNFVDITKGLGTVVLDQQTIDTLEERFYKIALKRVKLDNNVSGAVYVDANYGVPLDLEVLPAYYAVSEPLPEIEEITIDGGIIQ
jgi:hypothetical protein